MAATKTAKPNGKVEAALADLEDVPRLSTFRGIALTLPPKLPAAFALDMAEVQAGEGGNDLGPTYRLLVGALGQTQWRTVRDKIAGDGDNMDEIGNVLRELLQAITEPYGLESGEQPASGSS